ncbi:hypothetical protein AX16_008386 [Volvariella volvacea WC 439]|nr:hypothetical protein AX16_008386 [Volvariella volvacea WC 439]
MDSDDEIPTLIEHPVESDKDGALQAAVAAAQSQSACGRVPITIICGFLGAGKSTLLKRILTERHGYRIAVIMNEFGDTADIESRAINVSSADDPTADTEEFLELPNGCLCCSIKDTGVAAIEKLMQKKGAFDHILLETTGLADPGPIASMFWQNEEYAMGLGRDIVLDGVLCVVDAVFGKQQMEEDQKVDTIGESLRQIAGSDVIILNKTDLVTSPTLISETETLIHQINPAAPIHRTVQGQIDLKHIIGINAYGKLQVGDDSGSALEGRGLHGGGGGAVKSKGDAVASAVADSDAECGQQGCKHEHDHGHTHNTPSTHYELRGISSLQVMCPTLTQPLLDKLDTWIRLVLWESRLPNANELNNTNGGIVGDLRSLQDAVKELDNNGSSQQVPEPELQVLRCKGLFLLDTGAKYVLQGVRNMYEITLLGESENEKGDNEDVSVPQMGKVVLIGKGLDARVRTSLEGVLNSSLSQ